MFRNKRILIIGLGISGQSAAHLLLKEQAIVYGTDRQLSLLKTKLDIQLLQEKGLHLYEETALPPLNTFDRVVLSPGVPFTHPLVQQAHALNIPCLGEIALGCLFVKHSLIGITGTNGKTTVTLLTTHVLNYWQQSAKALGNVGVPLTQEVLTLKPNDKIVLELSSYQLESLDQPLFDAGVILNITPDHLDRYQTMENYAKAKYRLAACLKPNAFLYVEEQTFQDYRKLLTSPAIRLYGYKPTSFIYTDLITVYRDGQRAFELPPLLQGYSNHEVDNLLAAFALCAEQGISGKQFIQAWHSFQKPPHRIQFILEHQGVKFIDDSKGTNIDAVTRAVQSLRGQIVLIAGGVDKGAPYTPWLQVFKDKVKSICAIGQAAAKIKAQLSPIIPVIICQTLEEAVQQAGQQAVSGDYVLLSPGCSSFDMFKDYVHRGEEFQKAVCALTKGG